MRLPDIEARLDIHIHAIKAHVAEWLMAHSEQLEATIKAEIDRAVVNLDIQQMVRTQVEDHLRTSVSGAVRDAVHEPINHLREKLVERLRPRVEWELARLGVGDES